jgi:hypothetical protein
MCTADALMDPVAEIDAGVCDAVIGPLKTAKF